MWLATNIWNLKIVTDMLPTYKKFYGKTGLNHGHILCSSIIIDVWQQNKCMHFLLNKALKRPSSLNIRISGLYTSVPMCSHSLHVNCNRHAIRLMKLPKWDLTRIYVLEIACSHAHQFGYYLLIKSFEKFRHSGFMAEYFWILVNSNERVK